MEPISAGASVLAFVGIAIQSAKALHDVITGFKNATREIAALAAAVGNLQLLLTQFRDCKAFAESTNDLQNLKVLLDACSNDVKSFEKELRKVRCRPPATKLQQKWKKMRATVSEKSLRVMWNKLSHHFTVLQFELTLLNSNMTHDCKSQAQEIQATVSIMNTHVSSLNDKVQNVSILLESAIRSTVASVATKLEQRTGATTMQLENISVLLHALQNQMSEASVNLNVAQSKQGPSHESEESASQAENSSSAANLTQSLARLGRLQSRVQDTIRGDEAEIIIDDLGCLLNALKDIPTPSKKRKADCDVDSPVASRDLKRVCGLVAAASAIDVHQGPKRFRSMSHGIIAQQRKSMDFSLPHCTGTVITNRRKFQTNHRQGSGELYAEEIYARVKAIVNDGCSGFVVVAYIRQVQLQHGFIALNPIITMGKVLPIDSPIFDIVRTGNVDKLRGFVARGEVSLRDRDPRGTPLLHYAVVHGNYQDSHYDMCRYLVDNGADVDELAKAPFADCDRVYPPLASTLSNPDVAGLLLAAGADPTDEHVMAGLCFTFFPEFFRLFLDNPIPFFELERRDSSGKTFLLQYLCRIMPTWESELALDHLLAKGADVHARDKEGKSCLRLFLEWMRSRKFQFNATQTQIACKLLVSLIEGGADVFSYDKDGISVSDYAYSMTHGWSVGPDLGDLWDAALIRCGHDIRHLRKGSHRFAFYGTLDRCGRGYDRTVFEKLWNGWEQLCPYYDDPPVWCPESISPSRECPFGGNCYVCPGPSGFKYRPCNCWACMSDNEYRQEHHEPSGCDGSTDCDKPAENVENSHQTTHSSIGGLLEEVERFRRLWQ